MNTPFGFNPTGVIGTTDMLATPDNYPTDNSTESPTSGQKTCRSWIALISYSVVPLLFVIGLFGNSFTIVIMRSRRFRSSSTGIYLTALALSDMTFILSFPFVKSTTFDLFDRDVKAINPAGCKLFYCIFRSSKICSSWFVVLICVERFLAVWFPFKAKLISNKRIALLFTTCVAVFILTFEGVRTLGTSIVNGMCMPYYEWPETKHITATLIIVSTALYGIIPSVILLSATPLTIIRLIQHNRKRRTMTSSNISDETVRITFMLLAVMIAYVVLVMPIAVAHSVAFFRGDNIFLSLDPKIIVFREVAQVLEQLNYVINFFLYVIFNSSVRSEFCRILERRQVRDDTPPPPIGDGNT